MSPNKITFLNANCRDCDFVVAATDESMRFNRNKVGKHVTETGHTVDLSIVTRRTITKTTAAEESAGTNGSGS